VRAKFLDNFSLNCRFLEEVKGPQKRASKVAGWSTLHKNPSRGYDLLEETSPSFRWVCDFDVASYQLSAKPHNSRSNSEKKTSHNIEQHLYGFHLFPKYALALLKIHKKFDGCQASVGVFHIVGSK
jgi:hypothetical protein